jgi:hypothetical protein
MTWHCHTLLKKFDGESTEDKDLLEIVEIDGNLAMFGGISKMWEATIGNSITAFSNANAAIGVGDSTTAAAGTQTDMQAATNKLRKAMDSTYPQHTDGTASGNASIIFRSTFGTSEANFAWQEWGVFNSATAGAGSMLNRKVESLGTKASGSTWQLTVTLSIA